MYMTDRKGSPYFSCYIVILVVNRIRSGVWHSYCMLQAKYFITLDPISTVIAICYFVPLCVPNYCTAAVVHKAFFSIEKIFWVLCKYTNIRTCISLLNTRVTSIQLIHAIWQFWHLLLVYSPWKLLRRSILSSTLLWRYALLKRGTNCTRSLN
jgi:hypothetical protein